LGISNGNGGSTNRFVRALVDFYRGGGLVLGIDNKSILSKPPSHDVDVRGTCSPCFVQSFAASNLSGIDPTNIIILPCVSPPFFPTCSFQMEEREGRPVHLAIYTNNN